MIIGLLGVAGSGKDTVADIFVRDHNFVKVAFADPLKRICKDVFAFTDEQLWGPSEKRNAPDERYLRRKIENEFLDHIGDEYLTPRFALQQLGSEWGRNCYPNVWVDYALRVAKTLLAVGDLGAVRYTAQQGLRPSLVESTAAGVVISDVRFQNEVDAIRAAGGMVWKLTRNVAGLGGTAGQHRSETELLGIDEKLFRIVLENNASLEDLAVHVGIALDAVR